MSVLCSLPLIASLLAQCAAPAPFATGYVEGEYTLVAPVEVAPVRQVAVSRGDRVEAGQILVEMEKRDAEIAVSRAEAKLAQAQGQLADLLDGARPEEIEVIEASLATARLEAEESERTLSRIAQLSDRGVATDAQRDDAETAARVATAKVAQIAAELAVARLPARPQTVTQARASVEAAQAELDDAKWRLEQRDLSLNEDATISDILRYEDEIAGPAAPVLSVLPDGAVKLRLYVPQDRFSAIAEGDLLSVRCDGCAADLDARVTYISDAPEFTPPVIYSLENRQKLVYLIEARPLKDGDLKPGQIVDVLLPEAGDD